MMVLAGMHPPGPPLARPILPKDRGAMDRVIEYLVGDGPQNRCIHCHISWFTMYPLEGNVLSQYAQRFVPHLDGGFLGGIENLMCSIVLVVSSRYALICQQCFSHNGMALKEEFEYLGRKRRLTVLYF